MTDEPWGSLDEKKQRVLMQLFDISEEELSSTIDHNLTDLVLERVALLDVYK